MFAAVCVALSAAGHALAACATVPWWVLLAAFAGVLSVAVPLAGRERSLPSIAAALAGGQLALHTLFGVGTHTTTTSSATGGEDALIRFAASLVCGAGPHQLNAADARHIVGTAGIDPAAVTAQAHQHLAATPAGGMTSLSGTLPSLPMLLGHLLAALATGWLLRRGEVALFRLARLSAQGAQQVAAGARLRALRDAFRLVAALRAGLPGGQTTGPRTPRTAVDAPRPATGDPLQHMVIRRGPPSALALAA